MEKYTTKKILVAGGYGYGNTGDEAQCDATLKLLTERYPDYQIINLTPDVVYSKKEHPKYNHDYASRVLFFNNGRKHNCFDFKGKITRKLKFILKSILIYINALLAKNNLPTVFLDVNASKFLYELKEAELLYFCGGGYLTGRTLSRLWDGILVCVLASVFDTPVVMSGQTIGLWGTCFNKLFARWGLKNVRVITVRDENYSLNDLKEIGLSGEKYFPTHDDALFCDKSEGKQIAEDNYITLNFHYWGMKDSEKTTYIDKLNKIINYVLDKTDYDIVFIPMHRTDKNSFDDYISKFSNNRLKCFDYDYDFRKVRRVIADSKMCITMKHHPIIFAMGEGVPAISLAFSDYYLHKNIGALTQYKQDKYSVNLENDDYYQLFVSIFNILIENYDSEVSLINQSKEELIRRKEKFLKIVDEILSV